MAYRYKYAFPCFRCVVSSFHHHNAGGQTPEYSIRTAHVIAAAEAAQHNNTISYPEETMGSTDEIWRFSTPVDEEAVRSTGCFTLLPVRIHKDDHVAVAATNRLSERWKDVVADGSSSELGHSYSPVGSFSSLVFPECLPERLDSLAYLGELAFTLDEANDNKPSELTSQAQKDLYNAMKYELGEYESSERGMAVKKFCAESLLHTLKINNQGDLHTLKSLAESWTEEVPDTVDFRSYDEYMAWRKDDAGQRASWAVGAYATGDCLTPDESEKINHILDVADCAYVLINDYWSWPKEKAYAADGSIKNVVQLYMRIDGLSEKDAMEKTKTQILEYEQRFLDLKEQLYRDEPDLPFRLRRWVEIAAVSLGGSHFWSANCHRYQRWWNVSEGLSMETGSADVTPSPTETQGSDKDGFTAVGPVNGHGEMHLPQLETQRIPGPEVSLPLTATVGPESSNHSTPTLDDSALQAPRKYIRSMKSKNVRSQLIDAFNIWLSVPPPHLKTIKEVIDDLHNASLILDDIQDDSPLRRGKASTHLVFGPAQAINSATYTHVRVSRMVCDMGIPAALTVMHEELEKLFIGQSWDLDWKFHMYCPTEAEYLSMVDQKTGAMFRLLVRLMQVVAGNNDNNHNPTYDFEPLIRSLGRWFQIRDDYMNLQGSQYTSQKGFCEDLDEGKLSYPVVKTCEVDKSARKIIFGLFRQARHNITHEARLRTEAKVQILHLMYDSGALEATWRLIKELEKSVEESIRALEELTGETNSILRLLVKALADVPVPVRVNV